MKLPTHLITLLAGGALLVSTGCPSGSGNAPQPGPSTAPSAEAPETGPSAERPETAPSAVAPEAPAAAPTVTPGAEPVSATAEPEEECEEPKLRGSRGAGDACPGCGRG